MKRNRTRGLVFKRSPPFVEVDQLVETRGDHAVMVVIMLSAAAAFVVSSAPDAVATIPAFMAGDAFSNWIDYPEREVDDNEEVSA